MHDLTDNRSVSTQFYTFRKASTCPSFFNFRCMMPTTIWRPIDIHCHTAKYHQRFRGLAGAAGEIRTPGLSLTKGVLYP